MIVLRLASGVRSHFVTRMPEWALALGLLAIGGQLLRTGKTFEVAAAYRLLSSYVSEEMWGALAAAISTTWLVALILNGTFRWFRRISPWVRSISALAAAIFFGITSIATVAASPIGLVFLYNAGFAGMAFAASLIIAREVGSADREAKRCRQTSQTG